MAIITFWSEKKKETAQTLSMLGVATQMAVERNFRILVIDTYFDTKTIANAYWDNKVVGARLAVKELNKGKIDLAVGNSGLAQLVTSGKESPEMIKNYTRVVFKDRLEVLTDNRGGSPQENQRIEASFASIAQAANRYYDYVFVDLQKGLTRPFVKEILQLSNIIVLNLTQRLEDLDEFKALREKDELFRKTNILPLIGRYDRYSKYSKKNITRYLGLKDEVPAVSYNTLFFESANEGMLANYFLKFRPELIKSTDRNANLISEVTNAVESIMNLVKAVEMGL